MSELAVRLFNMCQELANGIGELSQGKYIDELIAEITKLKAEVERLKNPWVNSKDRVPMNVDRVLVAHRTEDVASYWPYDTTGTANSSLKKGDWFLYDSDGYAYSIGVVTHWMPLPEPPISTLDSKVEG